jgi:L-amino acid N-acyltransferase YncA
MSFELRKLQNEDLPFVLEIYNHYILNTTITFHIGEMTLEELKNIIPVNHPKYPSFIIQSDEVKLGYIYVNYFRNKQAFDRTAEITIYLSPNARGKGAGKFAIQAFEKHLQNTGIKTLIGVITEGNKISTQLFENCHYQQVAKLNNVGEKFGKIIGIEMWQKEL